MPCTCQDIVLPLISPKRIPSMEEQILDAPAGVEKKLQYAGFWIRVGAYLIDFIILSIVNAVVAMLFMGGSYSPLGMNVGLQVSMAVLGIAYFTAMESSSRQGTVGKMAVGIKVGTLNGEQISFGKALGRYFAKILSAMILCIGFMMAGWDKKKQGLHDKLAATCVYYG